MTAIKHNFGNIVFISILISVLAIGVLFGFASHILGICLFPIIFVMNKFGEKFSDMFFLVFQLFFIGLFLGSILFLINE